MHLTQKEYSLSLGEYKTLTPRYYGPYEIVKHIGTQAYKLSLLTHLKLHDVFHVSLLKPSILSHEHVLDDD